MEKTASESKSPFATEPVGRLITKFAIPCVISLLVNSLYNIVDQIFIGWGVGYLGNGATNVVFPITIIALALSLMIGDGGAGLPFMMIPAALNSIIRADGSPKYAMFSMILGAVINTIFDPIFIFIFQMGVQGAAIATVMGQVGSFIVSVIYMPRLKSIRLQAAAFRPKAKTCRNILTFGISSFITQFAITIVMALTNNLLAIYGASSVYGSEIPLTATGIVMKVNQILISILVGISVGAQPIIGFNYGAKNYLRVKKALDIAIIASEVVSILAFLLFQFSPMTVVSLFGSEEGLYNEFAVMAFLIFLLLCPLTGFQAVIAVYLQAVGKPLKSAILSLSRQIIFYIPAALLLPMALGVTGVLWTGPVADGLAFLLSVAFLLYERSQLKKRHMIPERASH